MLFLPRPKAQRKEVRVLCVKTTDGGKNCELRFMDRDLNQLDFSISLLRKIIRQRNFSNHFAEEESGNILMPPFPR